MKSIVRLVRFLGFALLITLLLTPASRAEDPAPKDARQGIFVAVGYGGRRMTSRDGIVWENVQQWAEKGEDDSNNLISVAFGKGKFVAVGGGGWSRETQAGHILVATDGVAWREVCKKPFRISPILFDGKRFIAGAPDHQIIWSDDGETWTDGAKVNLPAEIPAWAFWFRRAAVGNGIFLFAGNAGTNQKIWWAFTTRDGKTAANVATDLPEVKALAFGAGKFVIVSGDGIRTSADGQKWEHQAAAPKDELRDMIWTGSNFFLTGKQGTYTSADAISWKPAGKPIPCGVLWADGKLFLGTGWPGKMWSSTDGIAWTQGQQPKPPMGVNDVAWGVPGN